MDEPSDPTTSVAAPFFTERELAMIQEGLDDMAAGRFVTLEEIEAEWEAADQLQPPQAPQQSRL